MRQAIESYLEEHVRAKAIDLLSFEPLRVFYLF